MPQCSNCGKPVVEGAPYCLSCGAVQPAAVGQPAQTPPVYGSSVPPPPPGPPVQPPPAQGPPAEWPSAPVGAAPPPDQVPPRPAYAPAPYGSTPAAAPQAYAPATGPAAGAAAPPAAKRGGLPGWALALIIIGVALLVAIPVVLFVAPFIFIGNVVQDVAPMIEEQIDLAREKSVRDGVSTIQMGVEAWAADHDGKYPGAARVSAQGLVRPDGSSYVDVWPSNAYAGGPMTQGAGAGQFTYERAPKGAWYALTGYGQDGTILITVP